MTDLIALFFIFAKVSLLTFGGGLASLPFLYEVFVTEKAWLTAGVFSETVALAQMTPGPIILNSATLLGYRFAGLAGSITGTVDVVVAQMPVSTASASPCAPSWWGCWPWRCGRWRCPCSIAASSGPLRD